MLNDFIDFKNLRNDIRQLGIFTILAGLVGLFLLSTTAGAVMLILLGLGFWLLSAYSPPLKASDIIPEDTD